MATASDPFVSDPLAAIALATRTRIAAGNIKVPPYPAVIGRLQKALADDRASLRDFAQIVAADPVLTAMVLARASNAASGHRAAPSLEGAIQRVGGHDLVRLALAASLGGATAGGGPLSGLRRGRWQDALLAAGLCELLADGRGVDPERAYLAGLLHDFGAVVVIACLEEQLAKQPLGPQPEDAWARIIERHHLDAAVHVADAWKLPNDLAQVMAEHHDIGARSPDKPLLHLVWDIDRVIVSLTSGQPITGLQPAELAAIQNLLPTIVTHIAAFETAMPSVAATVKAASAVAKPKPEGGVAIDVEVSTKKGARYRTSAIWPDRIAFDGSEPLRPDWLAELIVTGVGEHLELLAHVRSCEPKGRGYAIVAQPFGLGGEEQAGWERIVEHAESR